MPISKAERLMDLVIALVNTRRYRTAAWIREHVAGYRDHEAGADAFARMFERDKQELRDMGIPIETDDGGYRISPGLLALPPLSLTPAESTVLAVASRLWETSALREVGGSAARKIRDAADIADLPDDDVPWATAVQARVRTAEPAFADLFAAVRAGRVVTFDYRGIADTVPTLRTVEPWGMVNSRGSWYLIGFDRDRQAQRTFRLSRIAGAATARGKAGAVTVPAGIDLPAAVLADHDGAPASAALLRIRPGRAAGLRRIATSLAGDGRGEWDDVVVPMPSSSDLARRVAAHGPDIVVVDPPELRDAVRSLLAGVVSGV